MNFSANSIPFNQEGTNSTKDQLKDIIGPNPVIRGLRGVGAMLALAGLSLVLCMKGFPYCGILIGFVLIIAFWMFIFCSGVIMIITIFDIFTVPAYNRIKRALENGEIQIDFYVPKKHCRGNGNYLIIDRNADTIYFNWKQFKLSDLRNVDSGYESYNIAGSSHSPHVENRLHLFFRTGETPEQKISMRSFDLARQEELRIRNFMGW